jgi:hypothetical protein
MSQAPPSPSFRPPTSVRRDLLPKLNRLSLGPPATPNPSSKQTSDPQIKQDASTSEDEAKPTTSGTSLPSLSPPIFRPRKNSQVPDDSQTQGTSNSAAGDVPADSDIDALDDEGWRRVAHAGGIQELLKLGEGASGAVYKCRLRKSGQVFAMKVLQPSL